MSVPIGCLTRAGRLSEDHTMNLTECHQLWEDRRSCQLTGDQLKEARDKHRVANSRDCRTLASYSFPALVFACSADCIVLRFSPHVFGLSQVCARSVLPL